MTSITVIVALTCIAQGHAQDGMEEFAQQARLKPAGIDRLVDRALQMLAFQHDEMDGTTLGKPGSVAISQKAMLAPKSMLPTSIARRPAVAPQALPNNVQTSFQMPTEDVWVANPFVKKKGKSKDASGSKYSAWPAAYKALVKSDIQGVTGPDALDMVEHEGALLVDVRREDLFQEETIEGAVNVPLFRKVQGNSLFHNLKRTITAINGVEATERNPDFLAMAQKELPRDTPIIIACDHGGLLDDDVPEDTNPDAETLIADSLNRYTLSLKALSELHQAGFKNLYMLKGGLYTWKHELPMVTHLEDKSP